MKAPRATPSWIALVLRLIWIAAVSGLSSTRYFWIAGPGAMLNTHQNTTAPSSSGRPPVANGSRTRASACRSRKATKVAGPGQRSAARPPSSAPRMPPPP